MSDFSRLPSQGLTKAELLETLEAYRSQDADWRRGRTFSLVYHAGEEHLAFIKQVHNMFMSENALNPMAFQSLKRMESEVVQMASGLLHGGAETVGTMTSGGTESILLTVKAARERAGQWSLTRGTPELVMPVTAHPAFDKAAQYFGLKVRRAPMGKDFRADVDAMRRLINRNTVLIVASAPQYAHGVVDPIEQIAAMALERNIPCHVDACVGGFMLPFVERLGRHVPLFDFRVPGVTSISADIHKYGYAAKGASVILYRDMTYLRHQFVVTTDWPGGIYASPTVAGTRPGGSIAAAWAAMQVLGESGYLELTRSALEACDQLKAGIRGIEGLRILGSEHGTIVTYGARDKSLNIYAVADQLQARGWSVDRQQKPTSVHLTVSAGNVPIVQEYLADLREAVAAVRANPELASTGQAAMYGMMAKIPVRGAVKMSVLKVMEDMYRPGGQSPDLKNLGGEEDASPLFKAIHRYGTQTLQLLDMFDGGGEEIRRQVGKQVRRGVGRIAEKVGL